MIKKLYIKKFRLFTEQEFLFGRYITAIAGQNAVGKSTLLGLLGNIIEDKSKTIFGKSFRTDFSEIFKASKDFDKSGEHKGTFTFQLPNNDDYEVSFRSTWQDNGKRFRVIPSRIENGTKVESKQPMPVIYLGLSRLYPLGEIGEVENDSLELLEKEGIWFVEEYKKLFSMSEDISEISTLKTKEVKSSFTGISTEKYDKMCNSAGQDNIGQVLLSLLSFQRLKDKKGDAWNGGLLIIDEIDATLHPSVQEKLITLLFKKAKTINMQCIFTTHSLSLLEFITHKYENKDKFSNDYKLYVYIKCQ